MIEHVFRSARVVRRLRVSQLGSAFDDLVGYLSERGHRASTIQQYVQGAEHFDGWLGRTRRAVEAVDEGVVDDFLLKHLPRCQCPPPCSRTVHQVRSALHHLLVVLRRTGRVPPAGVETSVAETIIEDFTAHLRDTRGASNATCGYSARYAREFLADQFSHEEVDFARIQSSAIVAFFAARGDRWSPGSMKVAATSLRRFFRYLEMLGHADGRLARAVPRIAGWRLAPVPRVLTDEQVIATLASFDSVYTGWAARLRDDDVPCPPRVARMRGFRSHARRHRLARGDHHRSRHQDAASGRAAAPGARRTSDPCVSTAWTPRGEHATDSSCATRRRWVPRGPASYVLPFARPVLAPVSPASSPSALSVQTSFDTPSRLACSVPAPR